MLTKYSLNIPTELSVCFVAHYNVQKNPPITLTMNLTNTIQSSHPISFKHSLLHYPPLSPKFYLLYTFSKQTLYYLLLYHMHAIWHTYYLPSTIYINIWWSVTVFKLTTQSSTYLCSYLPLTSNILLTTLSQTLYLFSSLDIRHQISHPHKITGPMSVL
jgi:hypothetical protein